MIEATHGASVPFVEIKQFTDVSYIRSSESSLAYCNR